MVLYGVEWDGMGRDRAGWHGMVKYGMSHYTKYNAIPHHITPHLPPHLDIAPRGSAKGQDAEVRCRGRHLSDDVDVCIVPSTAVCLGEQIRGVIRKIGSCTNATPPPRGRMGTAKQNSHIALFFAEVLGTAASYNTSTSVKIYW